MCSTENKLLSFLTLYNKLSMYRILVVVVQVFGGDMIPTDETVNYSKLAKFKVSHTTGPQGYI